MAKPDIIPPIQKSDKENEKRESMKKVDEVLKNISSDSQSMTRGHKEIEKIFFKE